MCGWSDPTSNWLHRVGFFTEHYTLVTGYNSNFFFGEVACEQLAGYRARQTQI